MAHFVVVGAGAAGLMGARELARAGERVTVLEARDRCGGRIWPLPAEEFGYPAEGGAEFVHGDAAVTRAVLRDAGLALAPRYGSRWRARDGVLEPGDRALPHEDCFYAALQEVETDLPIAEFLDARFPGPRYDALRRAVTRTVQGYDAADPSRASTLALREEWLARDDGDHGRVAGGYGVVIDYLAADCRRHGGTIRLDAAVTAIEERGAGVAVRGRDGAAIAADAAILAVPLPLLADLELPPQARGRAANAVADIGYGNVVKLLLRFSTRWWAECGTRRLGDLGFLMSEAAVPTWWTQHPAEYPVLTGWLAGPRAALAAGIDEAATIDLGLASLAEIFALSPGVLKTRLVAARAIDWGKDPFARGAYSYAALGTRAAQAALTRRDGGAVYFCGEAVHAGPDIGTVEAALASGRDAARAILAAAG